MTELSEEGLEGARRCNEKKTGEVTVKREEQRMSSPPPETHPK
jgi:hypothetical protein